MHDRDKSKRLPSPAPQPAPAGRRPQESARLPNQAPVGAEPKDTTPALASILEAAVSSLGNAKTRLKGWSCRLRPKKGRKGCLAGCAPSLKSSRAAVTADVPRACSAL